MEETIVILDGESSLPLDLLLSRRFGQYSRAQWLGQIKKGLIRRDGRKLFAHFRLPAGAKIQIVFPAASVPSPASAAPSFEILSEDSEILVLNKPAQITVHPTDQTPPQSTLLEILWQQRQVRNLQLLHRLDHGTSGVLLLAQNAQSAHKWQEKLSSAQTQKIYLAWVWGHAPAAEGCIDLALGKIQKGKVRPDPAGKEARTYYRVLQSLPGAQLLELRLDTGRTHQIRVHLSQIQCPIIGDRLYGSSVEMDRAVKAKRIYLHASKLMGEGFEFEAPLPGAFAGLQQRLVSRPVPV